MNSILTIAYSPNLRTMKFIENLSFYKFKVFLLTEKRLILPFFHITNKNSMKVDTDNLKYSFDLNPYPFLENISSLLQKFNTNFRFFFIPDTCITWIPCALITGLKITKKKNFDLIYVSVGPFSASIIAVLLKKIRGLPLVIDFRDAWTLNPSPSIIYPSKYHEFIDKHIEKFVINNADYIITATTSICKDYKRNYPDIKEKISVVPNGFDILDFPEKFIVHAKFTITYTGTIIGSGERPYDIFFQALKEILSTGIITEEDMQVLLIGSKAKQLTMAIKKYKLEKIVIITDRFSQKKTLEYTGSSHLLLVIELTNAVTTKIYEYLATGKPILAITSEGELAKLIKKYSDNSYVITSRNVDEIVGAIIDTYKKWSQNNLKLTNPEIVKKFKDKYNRKRQAGLLADVFVRVIDKYSKKA